MKGELEKGIKKRTKDLRGDGKEGLKRKGKKEERK